MKIEIKSREKLIKLLTWTLEDAPIVNEELNNKINEFHSTIQTKTTVTSTGKLSSSIENLQEVLTGKVANYIFDKYDAVFVTEAEKLVALEGEKIVELYDGSDRKLYLDASML